MADQEEMARIRLREFYLDQARRFTLRADEYAPARHKTSPLPIAKFTAVFTVKANSPEELRGRGRTIFDGMDAFDTSAAPLYSVDGRTTTTVASIYPEQTPEGYNLDLEAWKRGRA